MRQLLIIPGYLLIALAIAAAASAQSSDPQPNLAQPAAEKAKAADSNTDKKTGTNAAANGPTDSKAKHTFDEAATLFRERKYDFALDGFRKADKQDGGHCLNCEIQAYKAARQAQDFKAAREESALLLEHVTSAVDKAQAHFLAGQACLAEGINDKHDKPFEAADSEFQAALQLQPSKTECLYADGLALAHLKQDGAARERFQQYLRLVTPKDLDYERAERFADHPEMARARVAPNFRMTALDGRTITLESLTGKVVLVDFWATWCGPCREALPHVREIARKFEGQPFAVISISLDRDDAKWKDFVANNQMTWIQYRDGYFEGPIAKEFGVTAIPATFTIDADGVLQDQHVGDADIEGKIKKLIARAQEVDNRKTVAEIH